MSLFTPGPGLGLLLLVGGCLYTNWPSEPGADLPRHARSRIEAGPRTIAGLAYTADGTRLIWSDQEGNLATVDPDSGLWLDQIPARPGGTTCPAFDLAPDDRTVALGASTGGIALTDLETGARALHLPDATWSALALAYTPDGRTLIAAGSDDVVRAFDTDSWHERALESGPGAPTRMLAVSPDGRTLAGGGSDGQLRCWDLGTGRLLGRRRLADEGTIFVAYAPDGRTLAAGDWSGRVRLWDAATLSERPYPVGEDLGPNLCLAYSPDGRLLASAHGGPLVRLWDATTGRLLWSLPGHRQFIRSLQFAPDGCSLASLDSDGQILIWDLRGMPSEPDVPPAR